MTGHPILRTVAVAASAALLLSAIAGPASAARPKCAGKVATIVGTKKGEVIKGTNKADVIVARGGHDRIYGKGGNDTICGGGGHDRIVGAGGKDLIFGGPGRDKLYGGPGRDRLLGGPANDRLAGGPGNDACLQGAGTGLHLSCERPVIVPPAPPAPPEPPTLVIAYSDVNNNGAYDTGDVMISRIVDTNGSGVVDKDDTIKMGMYPTSPFVVTPAGVREAFEPWRVPTHTVATVGGGTNYVYVTTDTGGTHRWNRRAGVTSDEYYEDSGAPISLIRDRYVVDETDRVVTNIVSPSQPASELEVEGPGRGDDSFLDVIFYVDAP
jgi:hypothetical protein